MNTIQLFSGGALDRLKIFALGLMPFFSACLLSQLATVFIPKLRKYSFGGESGRDKTVKFAYVFTIILSIIQAYFIALWLENPARFQGMQLVANPGFGFRLMVTATITASVLLLLFIAEIINKHGIGNGVAIIAISPFFLKFVPAVNTIATLIQSGKVQPGFALILAGIFTGLAYGIFYLTTRTKVLEISDGKNKTSIYLRSSIVGHEPIGWGTGLILFPLTVASFTNAAWLQNLASLVSRGTIVHTIISAVLIAVFTYVYALIVFDPKYLNALLNKYGFSWTSTNDKAPEDQLDNSMSKVLMVTLLVLLAVNIIPNLVMGFLKMPYWIASLFCGTTVLLGVGVFSDVLHQAEFFKSKANSGIKDWAVCYTAFDEFEATIKAEFLKSKGIQALIEPFRFTWGMPVRTMVDQYKIYVPCDKKEEARSFLIS
jgi:preprotein translocase subunit SecY